MGILKGHSEPGDAQSQVRLDWVATEHWEDLRSVRLRALKDAPRAFTSEHGAEARWLEEDWRSAILQARWVVARAGDDIIGVARSIRGMESPEKRYIEALWVAPEFRRLGVGGRLMQWLIEREQHSGIKEILLWVINGNDYARAFYLRMGFRSTGHVQPIPGQEKDPGRTEELLFYAIGR